MYPYHSPRGVDDYYDSDIDSSSVSSSQCDSHDDNSSVMQKVVTVQLLLYIAQRSLMQGERR